MILRTFKNSCFDLFSVFLYSRITKGITFVALGQKMFSLAALNTHKHHSDVAALQRLEKVRHSSLQTTTNEDTIIEVIQKDRSESIYVTWNKDSQTENHSLFWVIFSLQQKKQRVSGRPTLQQGQISLTHTSKSLISWGEQSEVSLLFQKVSQVSSFHQRQKDPAAQRRKQ